MYSRSASFGVGPTAADSHSTAEEYRNRPVSIEVIRSAPKMSHSASHTLKKMIVGVSGEQSALASTIAGGWISSVILYSRNSSQE